jgi:hypothetical protein
MLENLQNLETAVEGFLAREQNPTTERIRELIGQFRQMPLCAVDDAEAEKLARVFEERHGVTMTIGAMLTDAQYQPWLDTARASITPYYWDRYKKLLTSKKMSSQVVATLDNVTDRVLGLLENPSKPGKWYRRGMVVGQVQSGKTGHYIGLICKAADAGYKLIVVIAGIHNNLRNQTQLRIDEGFVGRDSARLLSKKDERFIGVGKFDQTRRPVTFTNSVRDFNKQMATGLGVPLQNLKEPAVLVIKKNSSTLERLLEWLREHSAGRGGTTVDAPMLLIDDEADNASINIRHGTGEVSKINGQIRDLLKLFEKRCYVGYTATPFANIFIDPDSTDEMLGDDLFPRNFIVSLDPPSNYFGPAQVFLSNDDQIVRSIADHGDTLPLNHPITTVVSALPDSLVEATRTFIVARAIRLARGHQGRHCSMLVNASRFTGVQTQIRNELHSLLQRIQASCRVFGALPPKKAMGDPEIATLRAAWEKQYSEAGVDWPDVQKLLHEAAAPVIVTEINSRSAGSLNYADHEKTGLNVIAVGGYSLSRGLTLEGLMISYFLRNSMMYDTLMQMGRWFGYRPGYDDLCRVWMPDEAQAWYTHIAESIDELRDELRRMEASNATPEEFGLKVRSHPDTLIVTARNKMGSSKTLVVSIGLGNSFVETAILKRDQASLEANRNAAVDLAANLTALGKPPASEKNIAGGFLLQDVPAAPVLSFLSAFQNHPGSMLTDPLPVSQYIQDRLDGELSSWDILFPSVSKPDHQPLVDKSLGISITCQRRSPGKRSDQRTLYVTDNQRVASRGIEKTGLDDTQRLWAEEEYRKTAAYAEGSTNYPDRIYRAARPRPLLIVHLLSIGEKGSDLRNQSPVVAWSISFPVTNKEEKRAEYVVNTTWMREHFHEDLEEDEMGGDDES